MTERFVGPIGQRDASGFGHHPLQSSRGVEMVVGPDHPDGSGVGFAVVAPQIMLHSLDQALVGRRIVREADRVKCLPR